MKTSRIILADDHEIVIEGLHKLLSAAPERWQICGQTGDANEAIAQAVELAPDIAIIDDTILPLSGLETALEMRRRVPSIETLLYISSRYPACSRPTIAPECAAACSRPSRWENLSQL